MPEMPSADMRTMTNNAVSQHQHVMSPMKGPEFNISSKDVEGLVLEIKENLRLSAATGTMKAVPCSHISRKSSRASPYRIPGSGGCKFSSSTTTTTTTSSSACCGGDSSSTMATCDSFTCSRKNRRKMQQNSQEDDPYELLQRLLRNGGLVNEAVRRVKLGLTPKKQRYFYESDEETSRSPVLRLCTTQDS